MAPVERDPRLDGLAADLVAIPTENPPGREAPCAEFVVEWFDERDVDATLLEAPSADRPQAVAEVGTGEPRLVLNGHTDVVPADADAWTRDPYAGVVEDGRLYGRGSADMKTGLAVAMLAAVDLRDAVVSGELAGSLVVHAAMGEETGDPGTRTLLERGYGGTHGIVLEPTGLRTATSAKGLATYEVSVGGTAGHASNPEQGTSAVDGVAAVLDAVAGYDRELRDRSDPLVGRAYATVTAVEAGVGDNAAVLPDRARLVVDRRVLPGESVADVDAEVDAVLDALDYPGRVTAERVQHYAPAAVPTGCRLAGIMRERSAAVAGTPTEPWGIEAATDVRNFVTDAGIEAVTWGPGSLAEAHTVDESIDLREAAASLTILRDAARVLLDG